MKVLTVAIPCYNSQEYMKKAIESVLPGGDDVEIIVVDDGSKDNTKEIGAQYEKQYPGIVKLISKDAFLSAKGSYPACTGKCILI